VIRLLLDTHVWLWALGNPTRLSAEARHAIRGADAVVLSVASIWEVGVKHALGRLPLTAGASGWRTSRPHPDAGPPCRTVAQRH